METEVDNKNGIGLIPLIAIIVSGAIGGGVFNLSNDLANGATPGGVMVSWLIIGIGIFTLVLSFNYLVTNKPNLVGLPDYARAGFGDFVGFISGWGYWLSAWAGNVAFAVLMMTSVNYFFPGVFADANQSMTVLAVIVVSAISWSLTLLVINGVESAAFINAIVLIAKLVPLLVFTVVAIVMFKAGIFSAHFWENVTINSQGAAEFGPMTGSGLWHQIQDSLMVMIWVFVGIEGATMMGGRARRKSDAGRASIIGFLLLLGIYILLSLLPFGYYDQATLAAMDQPGLVGILEGMVGSWGGTLMALGVIISLLGAWLSWTMLPVESTTQLADMKLLPPWFGVMNKHNAPQNALILTQSFVQLFLIITFFAADAYNVFVYLCTSVIMVAYALVAGYMIKLGVKENNWVPLVIGLIAGIFQVGALIMSGWEFVWMATIVYTVGFALYIAARKIYQRTIPVAEWVAMAVITLMAIGALYGLFADKFGLRELLGL